MQAEADAFHGAFEMNAEWHFLNTSTIQKIKTNMSTLVQNGTTANRQAAKWKQVCIVKVSTLALSI